MISHTGKQRRESDCMHEYLGWHECINTLRMTLVTTGFIMYVTSHKTRMRTINGQNGLHPSPLQSENTLIPLIRCPKLINQIKKKTDTLVDIIISGVYNFSWDCNVVSYLFITDHVACNNSNTSIFLFFKIYRYDSTYQG